jgi:hypothetical protein
MFGSVHFFLVCEGFSRGPKMSAIEKCARARSQVATRSAAARVGHDQGTPDSARECYRFQKTLLQRFS